MKKLLPVLIVCIALLSGCSLLPLFGVTTKKDATAQAKVIQGMSDEFAAQMYKVLFIGTLDPNQLTDDQIVFLKKIEAFQAEQANDGELVIFALNEEEFTAFEFELSKKEIKDAKAELVKEWKANFDAKGNVIMDDFDMGELSITD